MKEVKRGQALIYPLLSLMLFLIVLFAIPYLNFTGKAVTTCTPQWSCTQWSPCYNENQIRSCVDTNSCGDISTKPVETQICGGICTSNWQCTDWEPEKCPKEQVQKKTCTDLNNCGSIANKPADTRYCTYFQDFSWIYWFIIIFLSLIILMIILLITKKLREILNKKNLKNYDYPKYSPQYSKQLTNFQRFLQENPEYKM